MTLKHFIERPVLASVISIVIVIGGLIGLVTLPVEQYPDIAPPTVMVRASYPAPAPRRSRNRSSYRSNRLSTVWKT